MLDLAVMLKDSQIERLMRQMHSLDQDIMNSLAFSKVLNLKVKLRVSTSFQMLQDS